MTRRLAAAFIVGLSLARPLTAAAQFLAPEIDSGRSDKPVVVASRHLAVTAHPLATEAAHAVLALGGSAVDAAIAAQLMLGLVEPQSSGIGGGAFLLHWSAGEGRVRTYDGREVAPLAARGDRFLERGVLPDPLQAMASGRAVGVPGVLRALELAHRRHGRLPWRELFQYAILAAEEGFLVTPRLHRLLERDPVLRRDAGARQLFYDRAGHAWPPGTRLVNRAYGRTLRLLAAEGVEAFYRGALADAIVDAVRRHPQPGDLTREDLARYRAIEREPVCGPYRRWRLCGMGPPSAGGVAVLQILGLLERTPFAQAAPASPEAAHLFTEAARLAYADRLRHIADPAFVPQPVDGLLEAGYLDARARLIGDRAMAVAPPGVPRGALPSGAARDTEVAGTSHLSIIDAEGNAVAMTTTIESAFGSRILVEGFLLNNQLTDFAWQPEEGGRPVANRVEGGKRPRSTMAPILVFDGEGRLHAALGSPGGPPIVLYVAHALVAMLDWGRDAQAAVEGGHFGSAGGPLLVERGTRAEAFEAPLSRLGHATVRLPMTSGLHVIERVPGGWRSGTDPRREGAARGE